MPAARAGRPRKSTGSVSYAESPSSDEEREVTKVPRPAKHARADSADEQDSDSGTARAKKRVKTAKAPRKSRAKPKGVDRLTTLPLDQLLEILGHLAALDLVLVRETSKSLYQVLSSPDAAGVWSRALACEKLPALQAGLLKPWQYAEMALIKRCTNCTKTQFIPDYWILRRYCRVCRIGTLFRLDHLQKNYPDAHPCTKLCVLESHYKPTRLTYEVKSRHAFRDDFETVDQRLWRLQAEDDADPALRGKGTTNRTRKTTTKRSPDAPIAGSRVAKLVKERKRIKLLVEKVLRLSRSLNEFALLTA
ncbi:hypothetical protein JCM10908_006523 [Rhodotorula pacifica]|uniref:uncharacterized protein n=1 Tax=Rhodotorula pacifica TaxID=1495444 RepID=UPI003175A93D